MKQILILGTGNAQLDAVLYLKNRGFAVHGVSYKKEGPCLDYLDYFELINISDVESIIRYVKDNDIEAVYSVGSDLAMPTACAVSERLGMPKFVSAETAAICNNKAKLRNTLGQDFIGNICYKVIRSPEQIKDWSNWPCIIKPVDSQGQRGVRKVESIEDFKRLFSESVSFSRSGELICEEYIDGPEISVNCFLEDGEMIYFRTSDRIVFNNLPGGIIHRHILPSRLLNENQDTEVRKMVTAILKRLDINNGPAYFQIKISQTGPKLVEVTPRLDGCHMWRLIKECEGIDLLDMTFSLLLNQESIASRIQPVKVKRHELVFQCQEPDSRMNREQFDLSGAKTVCWYYEDGESIRKINGLMEKTGYLIRELS